MRLADAVFRQGHLSDQAITEALMTRERPVHLDQCDVCAERALEMGRWLDAVRDTALEAADAVFTPERLSAQQAQIQRKLEQIDEPARVIAFPALPAQSRHAHLEPMRRRVAPAWLGVAGAAGLVIGALGGQAAARMDHAAASQPVAPASTPAPASAEPQSFASATSLLEMDLNVLPESLAGMNDITPRVQTIASRR
jgi:hypothetical protein